MLQGSLSRIVDAFCNKLINNFFYKRLVEHFNLYSLILLFKDCFVVSLLQFK